MNGPEPIALRHGLVNAPTEPSAARFTAQCSRPLQSPSSPFTALLLLLPCVALVLKEAGKGQALVAKKAGPHTISSNKGRQTLGLAY